MEIVFATNNKNKMEEVKALLPKSIKILSLQDIGCTEEIEETESTLEGNARLKADHVTQNYGYNCFADDTGLEVAALNGAPGVYSARFAGDNATYEDNVQKLLREMKGKSDRKARFRTAIALNLDGKTYRFDGICEGAITTEKRGDKGFGYDPVFLPEGFDKTFAEMSLDEKGNISHRGKAIQKLVDFLKEYMS